MPARAERENNQCSTPSQPLFLLIPTHRLGVIVLPDVTGLLHIGRDLQSIVSRTSRGAIENEELSATRLPKLANADILEVHDCAARLYQVTRLVGADWQSLSLEFLIFDYELLQLTLRRCPDSTFRKVASATQSDTLPAPSNCNPHFIQLLQVELAQLFYVDRSAILQDRNWLSRLLTLFLTITLTLSVL